MRFGSLFAGIGGFDLGLERSGMKCAWQVEIDPYAGAVLRRHWPHVRRWADVRTFPDGHPDDWRVDLICAGVPCQPISVAGKQKGANDERWMWGEALRVVADLKPKFFVAENPSGLLSDDRGRTFGSIVAALESVGYSVEWHTVSAADVGAPHRRERVWLVAGEYGRLGEVPVLRDVLVPDTPRAYGGLPLPPGGGLGIEPVLTPHRMADSRGEGLEGSVCQHTGEGLPGLCRRAWVHEEQDLPSEPASWWEVESGVCRVAHGVPSRVDRLRCLGNAVVPQVAEVIGRAIMETAANP